MNPMKEIVAHPTETFRGGLSPPLHRSLEGQDTIFPAQIIATYRFQYDWLKIIAIKQSWQSQFC
jgi:hypothetical protein